MPIGFDLLQQVRLLTAELEDVSFGEESFLPDELEIANRTPRSLGAVGAKALVPRIVREWIQPTDRVLDFGAGKDAAHAQRLKAEGYDVTAHEFGKNQQPDLHDPNALQNGPYDIVYASNVLNVQSNPKMLTRTLLQIRRALKPGGIFIGNFPKQPRKMPDFTPADMAAKIAEVFGVDAMTVKPGAMPRVGRASAEPVFFVRYKGAKDQPTMEGPTAMNASTGTSLADDVKEAKYSVGLLAERADEEGAGDKVWNHLMSAVALLRKAETALRQLRASASTESMAKAPDALKAAVKAIESAKKLTAGHMQPQVVKTDVIVVETDEGTTYLPGDDFGFSELSRKMASDEAMVFSTIESQLNLDEGSVLDVEFEKNKWLARSSAPGYMDATDWSMFDTEEEAWSYLIDMDPSLFTWTLDGGLASITMDSSAAAKAMKDAVQSIDGTKAESDGDLVYVKYGPSDMAEAAEMFETDYDADAENAAEVEKQLTDEMSRLDKAIKDELEGMGFGTEEG